MGERTKFVRENAKKHGIIGEKMTETERKFYQNSSKSWLSAVRSMETRGKKQLLPSNGNLYHYAGNNPVKYTDPDGRTNYVFYDPESFSAQAQAEAARMPVEQEKVVKEEANHYRYAAFVPEETVLIPVTTEQEFIDAWNKMENPTDVTLIFHGSAHTLNIDYKTNEYLSTSPDGKTPLGNPGTYIGSLDSKTIGTLKIYSCQGGNVKESDNVARCFKNNNTIGKLFASDGSLSFTRGKYEPKKSHEGRAEYKKKYNQEPQGLVEVR